MGLGKTYSTSYLADSNNNTGAVGEVLVSTATGINWANGSDIVGGPYLPLAGGTMTGTGNINTPDQFKLRFGAGNDFQIYHQGGTSGSYIDNYSGNMRFNNYGNDTDIVFNNDDGAGAVTTYLQLDGSTGAVVLNHYGSTKLSTTSTGVEVTGKITNLTAGTGNLDAVNVQQLNDATTGALIFKGTWSAASTTTSTTSAAVSSSTTVVISSSNTGISVGATVTGAALPAGITVTAIAVDEITLTISSAQSITSGATLTFTTVGGIPDLSQTARKVTGDYYICETAGVATPNGTGTTPDEWAVGDWVAFSDLATDAWQKIDNSSVLSGAGTGGTVPVWAGSGTSVTLGDSPITVSGSDTTFGGFISTPSYIYAGGAVRVPYAIASKMPMIVLSGGATNFGLFHTEATADIFSFDFAGVSKQSFYQNGNATFAGAVTSPTFSGDLNGTINTATTGATQTAGDNSTLIATTAYADAAAATGGGNFLPLAGGTMTGDVIFPGEEANSFKIAFTGASASSGLSTVDQSGAGLYIGANSKVNSSGVVVFHDTLLPSSGIYFDGWSGDDMEFYTGSSGNPTKRLTIEAGGNALFTSNVGIGTTAPGTYKLSVAGDLKASTGITIGEAESNDPYIKLVSTSAIEGTKIWYDNSVGDTYFDNIYSQGTQTNPAIRFRTNVYGVANGLINALTIVHNGNVGIGTNNPGAKLQVNGDVLVTAALLSNQENTEVDTGAETVASVLIATYTAAFFDFVIKEGTNLRAGTVFACHDGTNVVYTETSTNDLGDTSDVTLSVDISGTAMRLRATVTSDDWIIKSLIRAI